MKQGFTLIELLAVIVILAIIALIATPIVLNIISNTKENAQLRSAEMYLDAVEQALSMERMSNTNFKPNRCIIINEGNLFCEGYDPKIEVKVNGETPNSGSITFTEGKITQVELKYENGKTIEKGQDGNLIYQVKFEPGLYDEEANMTMTWLQLIEKSYVVVNNGILTSGYDASSNVNKSAEYLVGKLIIDDSVKNIGAQAFIECTNLTSVEIPKTIEYINIYAFALCNNLASVKIGNGITRISGYAFGSCENLTDIYYEGTLDEWNKIELINGWNIDCPQITVHCTDGDIIIPAS